MRKPLLVAYATNHESTHEVAEAVAARLRERGVEAEVRPARDVETLDPYGGESVAVGFTFVTTTVVPEFEPA